MKKMEEEWFCSFKRQIFISSINNYNLKLSNSQVVSRNSTFLLGYHHWLVQNWQWYRRLIQPRSVATWPILYPASVKESPRTVTKFICGFRKCHSVYSNIWEVSFVTKLLILMPLTRKCSGWIHLWLNFWLVLFHRQENKQAAEEIRSFPSLKLSKHEIVWKQHPTSLSRARDDSKRYAVTKAFFVLKGELILPQI